MGTVESDGDRPDRRSNTGITSRCAVAALDIELSADELERLTSLTFRISLRASKRSSSHLTVPEG